MSAVVTNPLVKRLKKLIIERARWLHGEGMSKSKLLRSTDGKMCCLGFYSLACGLSEETIKDRAAVQLRFSINEKTFVPVPKEMEWLLEYFNGETSSAPSLSAGQLMSTNDIPLDDNFNETDREKEIAHVFLKNGVEVEFV